MSHVTVDEGKWLPFGIDPSRYSSLGKLLHVSVFVFRFINWNPSQRKLIQRNELLTAILTSGGEQGLVTASEIKQMCLLWIYIYIYVYIYICNSTQVF